MSMTALTELMDGFNAVFIPEANTRLVGGFSEPLYQPAIDGAPAEIRFTRDYLRSALHEIAHWCIAGEARREQVDYGYWYRPDGRNSEEQQEFFNFEVKPQALELAFSRKFSVEFRVSCDNLRGAAGNSEDEKQFERQVAEQLACFERDGFPARARRFLELP